MQVNILDQDIYVNIIDDDTIEASIIDRTVNIYSVLSAATQAQVNAGSATGVYINPSTLNDFDKDPISLTDASTIDLTGPKHTLASSSAARTFTISHIGDDILIQVTLSATSATYTFPSSALCVSEGTASGDNTCSLSGVSGDKYLIGISKIGSNYFVGCKNLGQ